MDLDAIPPAVTAKFDQMRAGAETLVGHVAELLETEPRDLVTVNLLGIFADEPNRAATCAAFLAVNHVALRKEIERLTPACIGDCLHASDVGVPVAGDPVAYGHPMCPLHGDPVAHLRAEVGNVCRERDEARAEVERLTAENAEHRATEGRQITEIERLRDALAVCEYVLHRIDPTDEQLHAAQCAAGAYTTDWSSAEAADDMPDFDVVRYRARGLEGGA